MAAIVFDCDGVLVNTEILAAEAYRVVYARHGLTLDPQAFQKMLGLKQADILKTLTGTEGGRLPADAEPELSAKISELISKRVAATPGIAEMLRATEIPFCVASSSDVARIRLSLGVSGLLPHFEGRIFSSSMVKRGKPAPDLFLYAATQLGAAPSDCVVFEDSIAGITAAKAAGMYPVGYLGGGHLPSDHAKKLSAAGAEAIISDWSEAPALIAGLG